MIQRQTQLLRKFDDLSNITLMNPVRVCAGIVTANAKSLAPVFDGELRQGIYDDVIDKGDYVEGITYTNVEHAPYVELGTGPKGAENHAGISPNVTPYYSLSPWWIHESQIDKATAEHYHFFSIETDSGTFYQCTGQAAHPFMYPALKNNVDGIVETMATLLQKEMKEAVK